MGYALSHITVNVFSVGTFIKVEDCEVGSSYMQCCVCVGIYGKHIQVLQIKKKMLLYWLLTL